MKLESLLGRADCISGLLLPAALAQDWGLGGGQNGCVNPACALLHCLGYRAAEAGVEI